jgi:PIN domain nuclease of toxin-antitoxin system
MNLLLDTHTLLWWLDDNPTLSKEARAAISEPANIVFTG